MIKIAVTGAAGRMGRAIVNAVAANPATELAGALEREDSPFVGKDTGELSGQEKSGIKITSDAHKAFRKADCVIDFTHPDSTMQFIEDAAASGRSIVIGTTGFSHQQRERIKELCLRTRAVMAPNMSIGINLLLRLVQEAAMVLSDYDIEIIEAHHRLKKDAPSGTALRLAEVVAHTLNRDLEKTAVYERKGIIGERKPEEIGIQTIRAGDIIGDHTVLFATPGERIEITHKASSRDTFATGAVKAAVWLADKECGLYDMQDVLGLKGRP